MGAAGPQGPGWWQSSDGKWYPPQQRPAPAKGIHGCLKAFLIFCGICAVLGILALIALAVLANKVSDTIEKGTREMKANEVARSTATCILDPNSIFEATGAITNNTGEAQAFVVEVDFSVNGTLIEEASADTVNVAAGGTTTWRVVGVTPQSGSPTCDTKVFANLFDDFLPPIPNTVLTVPTT